MEAPTVNRSMGHDADLQRIMMNSTVVDFSKRAIGSPSVIDVFASINAKREALKLLPLLHSSH